MVDRLHSDEAARNSAAARAKRFLELHRGPQPFVMPNAWDPGSARLLAGLGFGAVATSSGAAAMALGRRDGQLARNEALAHARAIVDATELPVSADLENCFADAPDDAAETIAMAGAIGLAGGSIEDATGRPDRPIYDFTLATERVQAAAEAARRLDGPFVLTARCENWLHGRADLDDTLRRLNAYADAGADVLFAPGLPDLETVRTVCNAVSRPFSFMVGIPGKSFTVAALADAGVRRISLSTALYRAAMTGLVDAAQEVLEHGTFAFVERVRSGSELVRLMKR